MAVGSGSVVGSGTRVGMNGEIAVDVGCAGVGVLVNVAVGSTVSVHAEPAGVSVGIGV